MRGPGLAGLLVAVAACSGEGGSRPSDFDAMSGAEHLACAVDISAYTYLMAGGKIAEDPELAGQAALALGWHRNAYPAPSKSDLAADINAARAGIMARDKPDAIAARAAACIAAAVAKGQAK